MHQLNHCSSKQKWTKMQSTNGGNTEKSLCRKKTDTEQNNHKEKKSLIKKSKKKTTKNLTKLKLKQQTMKEAGQR